MIKQSTIVTSISRHSDISLCMPTVFRGINGAEWFVQMLFADMVAERYDKHKPMTRYVPSQRYL